MPFWGLGFSLCNAWKLTLHGVGVPRAKQLPGKLALELFRKGLPGYSSPHLHPRPAEIQKCQPIYRTITHLGTQCGSAAPRHTISSIKPAPCRDAHNAFRQNTQAPTAGGCTLICRTHVHIFALLHTPQAWTPTEDPAPRGSYQFMRFTHTQAHSYVFPHHYKLHTRVQADRPLPMTPFSCSRAGD